MLLNSSVLLFTLYIWYFAHEAGAKVTLYMEDVVEVYKGDSAKIHCHYNFTQEPSMVMMQWFMRGPGGRRVRISYSDLSMQKVDENTTYSDRISVAGDGNGETLTIVDIKLFDEREFFCQVNGMAAGNGEGKTHLKVFDPPEPPVIEAVHFGVSVNALPSKIATCESRAGFPKPNITWYRNHEQLHPKNGHVIVVTLVTKESTGLYTVQSDLQYKVAREDKDATFSCKVSYYVPGAVRTVESNGVNITVHYPTTSMEMWRESPEGLVKEGDTVEIRCQGDGNPPPTITFSREQEPDVQLDADHGWLVLKEVTRGDSGMYQCQPMDLDSVEYEEVMGSLQLTVHYLDAAVVVPKDSEVMLKGESLTATCNALSSLETQTVWLKDGLEVGYGHVLLLHDATFSTAGHYNCEVTVPAIPGLHTSGSVHIIVHGAPELRDVEKEVEMMERVGKWVNLTCEASGVPRPVITWTITGSPSWREVGKTETGNVVQSVMTLKVTTDTVASCNATNTMGVESKSFTITSIPIVTPAARNTAVDNSGVVIVIIIVSILLLAILGSVLYFLHKKGKLPCGRSGKQEITKETANKDNIVVEMKAEKVEKTEKSVLLKGVNGNQTTHNDQYLDLRN